MAASEVGCKGSAAAERIALKNVSSIEHRARRGLNPIDMVIALPYILVPQDQLEATLQKSTRSAGQWSRYACRRRLVLRRSKLLLLARKTPICVS